MKKLKELAPHERKVLENEFAKEELIQERLANAIAYSWSKYQERVFENMGGLEGIQEVCKQLEECGLTPEQAEQMSNEEFAKFLEEHDIKVK